MLKRILGFGDDREPTPEEEEHVREGLSKTRSGLMGALAGLFGAADITEETWEDLEAMLIQADVGAATSVAMVEDLRERARHAGVRRADELPRLLRHVMVRTLEKDPTDDGDRSRAASQGTEDRPSDAETDHPTIILMVGVNGSGKTTTIAKLAHRFRAADRSVMLVAGDTFRAAAIEQLEAWGDRVGVPVATGAAGGDPAAVVFDALQSAAARSADLVIVDTAGRLHTQHNLMRELEKVKRVIGKVVPGGPHETLLVLDATTGQNGLMQARRFMETAEVTGIVLAKLDSSAKGGVAFGVTRELGLPIRYVGTGERLDDLAVFDAAAYVDGLLGTESSAR